MLISIVLIVGAAYILFQTFSKKSKLLGDQIPKEQYKVLLPRLQKTLYTVLSLILVLCALCFIGQESLFDVTADYTFSEDYTAPDGTMYTKGQILTQDEMQAVVTAASEAAQQDGTAQTQSAFSLCAPTATEKLVPWEALEVQRTLKNDSFNFLGNTGDKVYKNLQVISYVLLGIAGACLVGIILCSQFMVDKEAQRKAREAAQGPAREGTVSSMPSSAFNFDDDKK